MFSKVRVSKRALDYFRKLARKHYPLEFQAYLAGKVNSIDEVEITDFLYTKEFHTQTTTEVCWYNQDFNNLKEKVESQGKRIIGEIHSHPGWDAVMSGMDFEASVTQQLVLCGICSINESKKTRVRFWTPTSALPCRIIYK